MSERARMMSERASVAQWWSVGRTSRPGARTCRSSRFRTRAERDRARSPQRDARFGQLLLAPTLLIVLVVVVVPILWTVVLAFQDLRLIDLRRRGLFGAFTLDNFIAVFSSPGFWTALRTTLLFSVVGTVSSIGIGLAATLALRGAFRGRTFVRASMLLPYVAPVVAVTFVWQTMLSPQFGIVNAIGTRRASAGTTPSRSCRSARRTSPCSGSSSRCRWPC